MTMYEELQNSVDSIATDGVTFAELEMLADKVSEFNRDVRAQRAAIDKAGVDAIKPESLPDGECVPDGYVLYPAFIYSRALDEAAMAYIEAGNIPDHYKSALAVLAIPEKDRAGWFDRTKSETVVSNGKVREETVKNWGFQSFAVLRQEARNLERAERLRRMYGARR